MIYIPCIIISSGRSSSRMTLMERMETLKSTIKLMEILICMFAKAWNSDFLSLHNNNNDRIMDAGR